MHAINEFFQRIQKRCLKVRLIKETVRYFEAVADNDVRREAAPNIV